jgi:NADPH:quinone reductase-like Zn-dependent oxidoreductase
MCWQVPITQPDAIRARLVEQVTGRVRWRESVEWMAANGVDTFIEIGTGKALSGMIKRMVDGATIINVATPEDVDRVADHLGALTQAPMGKNMFSLEGRTALVTGASGGIGGEIAKALVASGAKTVITGTREAVLADKAAELGELAVPSDGQPFRQ